MRSLRDFLTFSVMLASGLPVRAGLYDPAAPHSPVPASGLSHPDFLDQLTDVQLIALPDRNTPLRQRQLEVLKTLADPDGLSVPDLRKRATAQLRLRQTDAALETLKRAEAQNPRDAGTMLLLAAALFQSGQPREAARYQEAALDSLPPTDPLRPTETLFLKLLRLRARESRDGRVAAATDVDELFSVRFVGPSGEYEAGKLAEAERAKLPANAKTSVQQLLLWFPDDTRLMWLLGELLNASGDVRNAAAVFDDCIGSRRFDAPLLRQHRQAVRDAVAAQAPPAPPPAYSWLPGRRGLVVGAVMASVALLLAGLQVRQWWRRWRKT